MRKSLQLKFEIPQSLFCLQVAACNDRKAKNRGSVWYQEAGGVGDDDDFQNGRREKHVDHAKY